MGLFSKGTITRIFDAGGDPVTGRATERGLDELGWLEKKKAAGENPTPEEVTTANLFRTLSSEQKKDLLINNPNITTPQGGQYYDPYSNTLRLTESDFTKGERLRQEGISAQLSGSLSGDFSNNGQAIQDATFQRGKAQIDPIVKQQKRDLAQQLADQGIPAGSERYNEAMNRLDDSISRQYTDLSQASIATSEQVRSQRFNEIASLLGRSQVGTGAAFSQNNGNFSGLDLFGAEQAGLNRQFQQSMLSQQLKQQNKAAMYQAVGTAVGAGAAAASDRNLKENIQKVGEESGFNIYEFNYKDSPKRRFRGVMAQEVLEKTPNAVVRMTNGFLAVCYDMIGLKMEEVS